MVSLYRDDGGRVIGVTVDNNGAKLNIGARKALILATGGSTGNVNFCRMAENLVTRLPNLERSVTSMAIAICNGCLAAPYSTGRGRSGCAFATGRMLLR